MSAFAEKLFALGFYDVGNSKPSKSHSLHVFIQSTIQVADTNRYNDIFGHFMNVW